MRIKVRETVTIKFQNEWASAELIIWEEKFRTSLGYKGRAKATLGNVYARKRREGYGSDILRRICQFCDDNNIQIGIGVDPYGPGVNPRNYFKKREETILFYKTFGFKNCGNGWFVRSPQSQK